MSFLKSIWKNSSKHKKLSEELALQKAMKSHQKGDKEKSSAEKNFEDDSSDDVVTFKVKYLGSTAVEKVSGDSISKESVKNIIKVAQASGKKLPRINASISLKGISVTDSKGNDMFDISIYRISNCSTDKSHRQVFSFISTDSTETMECHAFWCGKRKTAELVALTVAKAFSGAYEAWRLSPNASGHFGHVAPPLERDENLRNEINTCGNTGQQPEVEEKLIDFDDDPVTDGGYYGVTGSTMKKDQWVCFEEDFENTSANPNKTRTRQQIDLFFA